MDMMQKTALVVLKKPTLRMEAYHGRDGWVLEITPANPLNEKQTTEIKRALRAFSDEHLVNIDADPATNIISVEPPHSPEYGDPLDMDEFLKTLVKNGVKIRGEGEWQAQAIS